MEAIFEGFEKILNIKKLYMSVTQKIHGTNGQIYITNDGTNYNIHVGSRNRWLSLESDNQGFCKFVMNNSEEIIEKLGVGRHFGEWAGKGINTGEGMSDKKFFLFNWQRWSKFEAYLPHGIQTVPVLYCGKWSRDILDEIMDTLKSTGSRIMPGYMKPEGIVIDIGDKLYKMVFDEEEVKWTQPDIIRSKIPMIDVNHLLQPERLKKIVGQDEQRIRDFPSNIQDIVKLYYRDLIDEGQITLEEMEDNAMRKSFGRSVYPFIKFVMQGIQDGN